MTTRSLPRGALFVVALALTHSCFADQREPTPESGIGVWYAPGAPAERELWRPGDPGERLLIRGRVLDVRGAPVAGARVELWHADADGVVHENRYRATLTSAADGSFSASTVLPGYIWGPRHIHVLITHVNHPRFVTRIFFRRDPEVGVSGDPALAVILEDGQLNGEPVLFADLELVLRDP